MTILFTVHVSAANATQNEVHRASNVESIIVVHHINLQDREVLSNETVEVTYIEVL